MHKLNFKNNRLFLDDFEVEGVTSLRINPVGFSDLENAKSLEIDITLIAENDNSQNSKKE